MKKVLLLATASVFAFGLFSNAQAQRKCYSHERHTELLKENPSLAAKMHAIEEHTQNVLKGKPGSGGGDGGGGTPTPITGTITLPVYIHVIYNVNKPQENISNAQIQSQIDVLNKDYSATNGDISQVPGEFAGFVANSEIAFTWNTANIKRIASTKTSWGTRDAMKKSKMGGSDPVPGFLNMWVCEIGGGILGYAQFPGGSAATDGVVMGPNFFGSSDYGSNFYLSAPYDKGRTATHEVGHWLNLRHIWGDGGCGATDYVDDTPDSDGPNYGCPNYPSVACGTTDMTMNYMDYTDDPCMYMFTTGQKGRMRAIFEAGGPRSGMVARVGGAALPSSAKVSNFEVSVYPNPASSVANINVSLPETVQELSISVIDMQGRTVSAQTWSNIQGVVSQEISVSGLKSGVYFVNIASEKYNEVKKMIVVE